MAVKREYIHEARSIHGTTDKSNIKYEISKIWINEVAWCRPKIPTTNMECETQEVWYTEICKRL